MLKLISSFLMLGLVSLSVHSGWVGRISNKNYPEGEVFEIFPAADNCPPVNPPLVGIQCGIPVKLVFDNIKVSAAIFGEEQEQRIFIWFGASDYEIKPLDKNQVYNRELVSKDWPPSRPATYANLKVWYKQ